MFKYCFIIVVFCIRLERPLHSSMRVKQIPKGPDLCLLPIVLNLTHQ